MSLENKKYAGKSIATAYGVLTFDSEGKLITDLSEENAEKLAELSGFVNTVSEDTEPDKDKTPAEEETDEQEASENDSDEDTEETETEDEETEEALTYEQLFGKDVKAEDLNRDELKAIADREKVEVTGTGKNGSIKKDDYLDALNALVQ